MRKRMDTGQEKLEPLEKNEKQEKLGKYTNYAICLMFFFTDTSCLMYLFACLMYRGVNGKQAKNRNYI